MACSCQGNSILNKKPEAPCLYCAHKHVAAARALYDLEPGYRSINRSDTIGQLILAAWHLQKEHMALALQCRDCWLAIERREDTGDRIREVQTTLWHMINTEEK